MGKTCIICEEKEAEFKIKDTSDFYCNGCAQESFGDVELLVSLEDEAQKLKQYLKERIINTSIDDVNNVGSAQINVKIINVDEYPLTRLTSTTASETAKVLENTYRAVNIALMDEWGKFAEHVGIDLFEVVNAIKMRPTHSNIMRPGFGVGGYCLTKDPSFAPASYRQLFSGKDNKFPISTIASRINYNMPQHVADLIKQSLGGSFLGRNIHILGVSYREDVGDTRFSPAETFAETCIAQGGNVTFSDPYVDYWEELDLLSVNLDKFDSSIDVLVFGTPHSQYKEEGYVSNKVINPKLLVFDTNNVLSKQAIQKFKKLGCELFFIGKG